MGGWEAKSVKASLPFKTWWVLEETLWVKYLLFKCEAQSSDPQHPCKCQASVAAIYNPSAGEEDSGSLEQAG